MEIHGTSKYIEDRHFEIGIGEKMQDIRDYITGINDSFDQTILEKYKKLNFADVMDDTEDGIYISEEG